VGPGVVAESLATYSSDYANLLQGIDQALGPGWVMANVGDSADANAVVAEVPASYAEGALQPLSGSYVQFEALSIQTAQRQGLATPTPYLVLDSTPAGGSPTDPRTQIATLAEYYLLANPTTTFLDFYGGYAPNTSWSQHWSPAAAYNVGQPTGSWFVTATGADPSNPSLTYKVYQRDYGSTLVLYKPLSYGNGITGTTANNTATTLALGGSYRPLQANGELGKPITSVSLRNGEGAILVKAG
jgi:hypothetical protein